MSDLSYPGSPDPEATAQVLAAEALLQRFGALVRLAGRQLGLEAAEFDDILAELRTLVRSRALAGESALALASPAFHQLAMTAAMTVLERRRAAVAAGPPPTVTLEAIRRLAEGEGAEMLRSTLLVKVEVDAARARELALLRAVLAGTALAPDERASETRTRWLAAGVALLVIATGIAIGPRLRARRPSPTTPAATAVASGDRLAWPSEPGAVRYHVEVVSAAGDSLLTLVTRDTVVALFSARRLPDGARWRVITRRADGTDLISSYRDVARRRP